MLKVYWVEVKKFTFQEKRTKFKSQKCKEYFFHFLFAWRISYTCDSFNIYTFEGN